jgi:hypothetical protein
MNEHHPLSLPDFRAISLFLTQPAAYAPGHGGGEIEYMQVYGAPALEEREARAARDRETRRTLEVAGVNPAALPWDLSHEMGLRRAEITVEDTSLYGERYTEPGFRAGAQRSMVSLRKQRMHQAKLAAQWEVLEVYCGEVGQRFEDQSLPRIYALLHLTKAGHAFLGATQSLLAPSSRGLPAPDRMRSHCRSLGDARTKYAPHMESFAAAEMLATRMFRESAQAWNGARGGL